MAEDRPRRRWLFWALGISLGINLAVAGLVAGLVLHGPPPRKPPPDGGEWIIARDLPDPYRHDMLRRLKKGQEQWIGERKRLENQRLALAEALEAEPFDLEAITRILADGRVILDALAARGSDLLVEQISRMPPEDRAAYAEALREPRKHPPPHSRK